MNPIRVTTVETLETFEENTLFKLTPDNKRDVNTHDEGAMIEYFKDELLKKDRRIYELEFELKKYKHNNSL